MSETNSWVWAERDGTARYIGRNGRGASVAMGRDDVAGAFTPGELLGIALAGCAGLSADAAIEHRFGPEGEARIEVSRLKHHTQDRYTELAETITLALDQLDVADRVRLGEVISRSIERTCTVGNTLKAGAEVQLTIAQA